jgi:hypothetical protein
MKILRNEFNKGLNRNLKFTLNKSNFKFSTTIFDKIVNKEINSTIIYEDDDVRNI